MRAIWKGAVSFGLVNVPVRLYSATENHDVQFRPPSGRWACRNCTSTMKSIAPFW